MLCSHNVLCLITLFSILGLKEHYNNSHDVKKGDWLSISQCRLVYSLWRCGTVHQLLHPKIPVMAVKNKFCTSEAHSNTTNRKFLEGLLCVLESINIYNLFWPWYLEILSRYFCYLYCYKKCWHMIILWSIDKKIINGMTIMKYKYTKLGILYILWNKESITCFFLTT